MAPLIRYSALFALRDAVPKAGDDALEPLCECLASAKESALLKHEVAFVLGQLEHTGAVDALCDAVSREHEHSMVRHEAAEALGAIGTARAIEVLREHAGDEAEIAGDEEEIVRESCWVALMWLE
jgi:deoxyhypusine monooxygenase